MTPRLIIVSLLPLVDSFRPAPLLLSQHCAPRAARALASALESDESSAAASHDDDGDEYESVFQCEFCEFESQVEAEVVECETACMQRAAAANAADATAAADSEADAAGAAVGAGARHRAGFVSILGIPNVGKSTLLNALVGERLSIMTSKPQTTRHRIMGILNGDDYQIVYSDTPGVLLPQYKLQEGMMAFVRSSVNDADVLILVVDIFQDAFPDEQLLRQLRSSPAAMLVLLNKVDLLADDAPNVEQRRAELGTSEELLQRWGTEFPDATVLPMAAREGEGVGDVLKYVLALMPEHPPYFPKDELSDKPERFFASEFLREAIFEQYREEVPYSCEVVVDSFKETDEIIRIRANIFVSHDSQKGIVIGHKGTALKKVGIASRKRLEDFFRKQVFLETRVKVKKNWREDEGALAGFGYL